MRIAETHTRMLSTQNGYDAIRKNPRTLAYVHDQNDYHVWLAVQRDGLTMKFALDKNKTVENCMEAVRNNGMALRYIQTEFQTKEIALAAIRNTLSALKYVASNIFGEIEEMIDE